MIECIRCAILTRWLKVLKVQIQSELASLKANSFSVLFIFYSIVLFLFPRRGDISPVNVMWFPARIRTDLGMAITMVCSPGKPSCCVAKLHLFTFSTGAGASQYSLSCSTWKSFILQATFSHRVYSSHTINKKTHFTSEIILSASLRECRSLRWTSLGSKV